MLTRKSIDTVLLSVGADGVRLEKGNFPTLRELS